MDSLANTFSKFFGVALKGQTYLNALYLLLAFPLGLFYFIFLVTGLSLGFPLLIVWIGVFILLAVFAGWYALVAFERQMAIGMLGEEIPPMTNQDLTGKSMWQKFTATLRNPVTWKGLVYLFAKFPLGTLSFVVLVTFGSVSLSLLAAPFYYQYIHPQLGSMTINGAEYYPVWMIDTLPEALLACLAGLLMLFVSLHVFNGLAWVSGKFARVMLGNFSTMPSRPETGLTAPVSTELNASDHASDEVPSPEGPAVEAAALAQ